VYPLLIFYLLLLLGCQPVNDGQGLELITPKLNFYGHAQWHPDGKSIFYQPRRQEPFTLFDISDRATNTLNVQVNEIYGDNSVDWIDSNRLVYTRFSSETSEMVAADIKTGEERVLLTDVTIYDLCWSQPAQKLLIVLREPESSFQTIHGNVIRAVDLDGGKASLVHAAQGERNIAGIDCRKDASEVAVVERQTRDQDESKLFVTPIFGGERRLVYEAPTLDGPSWSPDGEWIALRQTRGTSGSPIRELLLVSADGSDVREVDPPWSRDGLIHLHWSPTDNVLLVRLIGGLALYNYRLYLFDISPWIGESEGPS
jgi:Tol biopolymer transport system component